eukprot:392653-Amorphochlora_amoeboformis.AAC.1
MYVNTQVEGRGSATSSHFLRQRSVRKHGISSTHNREHVYARMHVLLRSRESTHVYTYRYIHAIVSLSDGRFIAFFQIKASPEGEVCCTANTRGEWEGFVPIYLGEGPKGKAKAVAKDEPKPQQKPNPNPKPHQETL